MSFPFLLFPGWCLSVTCVNWFVTDRYCQFVTVSSLLSVRYCQFVIVPDCS
ncbi:MAG: hypothetical protein IKX20_09500 [Paludibacteraceae bacterium]|nr:hypothetical protein [Paludibacteraceae bacterium]